MQNLNFEKLSTDVKSFILNDSDSYINTYSEFIEYFKRIDRIEKHHLIISSHFVYGWMPTIIQLNTSQIKYVLEYLNEAKQGILLSADKLEVIKKCINNSLVGTSKLLHFINPRVYPIWDSRIFRYLTGKKNLYGIDKPITYLKYLDMLNEVSKHPNYNILHLEIERNFIYKITPMRAIEILMFETDRKQNSKN